MRAALVRRGTPARKPAARRRRLTYADFLRFPDDGKRHELIDGRHWVTPSPNIRHQRVSGRLHLMIGSWLEQHPIGQLFYAPLDVVFSNFDIVEPDLLYVSNARAAEVLTAKHVAGVPELVIEIGSRGTRKRDDTVKRRLYEEAGVDEYWIVDPEAERIRLFRRDGERFGGAVELSAADRDVLTTPLLPGLAIPLPRVFEER